MLSNGDSPASPDMIPPDLYRKFASPYETRLACLSHELGLPYLMHICGNTNLILSDMKEAGFDAVELDYKTDIRKVFEAYHNDVAFFGNIDPSGVIALGTPSIIRAKVIELLTLYKDTNRFVLNAGCAIPPETPEENIRALVETARGWQK